MFVLAFFSISLRAIFLSDGTDISISLQVEFTESLMMISGLLVFAVFVVRHRFWLVLVPLVCNLDIMILTDVPVEIRCSFIVPGDIFCFG